MIVSNSSEEGVSNLVSFILLGGILVVLMMILLVTLQNVMVLQPEEQLSYYAFEDIANGVSTKIVLVYTIAPEYGSLETSLDLPDSVASKDYQVTILPVVSSDLPGTERIEVRRNSYFRTVPLSGIGATLSIEGNASPSRTNKIKYSNLGVPP